MFGTGSMNKEIRTLVVKCLGIILVVIAVASCLSIATKSVYAPQQEPVPLSHRERVALNEYLRLRIGIVTGEKEVTVVSPTALTLRHSRGRLHVEGGETVRFRIRESVPAQLRYHVRVGTLTSASGNTEQQIGRWEDLGYRPELLLRGHVYVTSSGRALDTRMWLISVASFENEDEARQLQEHLSEDGVPSTVEPERSLPPHGTIEVSLADGSGTVVDAPITTRNSQPVVVKNVNFGFWNERREDRTYRGPLEIGMDSRGLLQVVETITVEEYLRGVVPAEVPSKWPLEVLRAQAIIARGETLAKLNARHSAEDFDLCATEHCQAYAGAGWDTQATARAVKLTKGRALLNGDRIVDAVYCMNCGGHTENNDNVWSSPPSPALRGVADFDTGSSRFSSPISGAQLVEWLTTRPRTYCSNVDPGHEDDYRWRVTYSAREIDKMVNAKYDLGTIKEIRPLERGVSGKLKSIRIVGSKDEVTVRKELPIRTLFGGLFSAMFIVATHRNDDGVPASFEFVGGGRGHGVGLCQDGARGLALAGWRYDSILSHYYSGTKIVKLY